MISDRELLNMAAQAAGISRQWDGTLVDKNIPERPWNPIDDDGDAFRLMVKLRMWRESDEIHCVERVEDHGGDELSATRKAIVRAAAEIWRAGPNYNQ